MTTKTDTEQLRADFEAWASQYTNYPQKYDQIPAWLAYQAGRAALQSQDREAVKRPVLDGIVDEIHRRADKEWADNGYDFEVTISADEYRALCEEEKSIDHARRVEGEGE